MSYNYLPLDHKPLRFHQLKNLLTYDQLVSITFTSHEHIIENINQIKDIDFKSILPVIEPKESSVTKDKAVPLPVVKLLLMLKIKSLSYGKSCVQIDTVKTMMEMYNAGNFPTIYFSDDVSYKLCESIKENSKTELKQEEIFTLNNGNQFALACGLYTLIKVEEFLNKLSWDENFKLLETLEWIKQHFNSCLELFLKQANLSNDGLLFSSTENNVQTNNFEKPFNLDFVLDSLITSLESLQTINSERKIIDRKELLSVAESL